MKIVRFDPAATEPKHLLDRKEEGDFLFAVFDDYLERAHDDASLRLVFSLLGSKGCGKTILARAVLNRLADRHSASCLRVPIDCRGLDSFRDVLAELARGALAELRALSEASAKVPAGLFEAFQTLELFSRYDKVDIEQVHKTIRSYKAAIKLGFESRFLKALHVEWGLSYEHLEQTSATGSLVFTLDRLCSLACGLLEDVRRAGFLVLVHIDNLDELGHHRYHDASQRARIQDDVDSILRLRRAPIGLLLGLRDYYQGVLPREITERMRLETLDSSVMLEILERRIAVTDERPETRAAVEQSAAKAALQRLAEAAPTPLAFLVWAKFLLQREQLDPTKLGAGLDGFLQQQYTVDAKLLRKLAALVRKASPVDAGALLKVCNGSQALMDQLLDRQVVLPVDFWNPVQFTLDPELFLLFVA